MSNTEPTLQELKAAAYDTLAQIQSLQSQLQQINDLIAQKSQEEPKPAKSK